MKHPTPPIPQPRTQQARMHVKQAANVLELLEYFARRRRPATLAEMSDDLGWPRSSTFNLIGTLADKGFLYEPRVRGGYYPTPRWLALVQSIADAEPLPEAVHQLAAEIAGETGETTAVAAPAGTYSIFIHVVESSHAIRYITRVGDRIPLYASSVGRAILAQYSSSEREALYRRMEFERFSETTYTSIDAVEAELRRATERGYHQSNAEFQPDLAGVSLPLPIGQRRLSIVVAGPVSRCLGRRPETAAIIQRGIRRFADALNLRSCS
ncbi:transcriptional regulator, IclR family [Azospirillum oryzae]|uniref:Transcriptional regulator, IclR family n=1 Tax=Azospirillum oryzae TaxID=286727 RepID=A0A1X7HKK3_9PROT|nr:IclR family transcriptional regulator [Azospirillum oryzae]SMF88382.1 transcriptional regulator, IclR family [Azospirillum oryzae]